MCDGSSKTTYSGRPIDILADWQIGTFHPAAREAAALETGRNVLAIVGTCAYKEERVKLSLHDS
jgi:hypothetical protein